MKVHPLMILLLVIVIVGASVLIIIHFAIIPLSSEHETLQENYVLQSDALTKMTEQYKLAKVIVQNRQDEMSVACLEAYIFAAVINLSPDSIKSVAKSIIKYHREFGISIELLVGIVNVESVFNSTAFSGAGARGLMQVIFKFHKDRLDHFVKTEKELHDSDIGVHAGTIIIDYYLTLEKGNLEKALHRYNGIKGKKGVYSSKVYARACEYSIFKAKYFFDNDAALDTVNVME